MLETENELAKKYEMSGQTVRQALGLFEAEGILERKRGSGTYVRERKILGKKMMTIGVIVPYIRMHFSYYPKRYRS